MDFVGKNIGLPAVLMCEMGLRIGTQQEMRTTSGRRLMDAAWKDAGYSIDAPEEFPAGASERYEIDAELGAVPAQVVAYREPA